MLRDEQLHEAGLDDVFAIQSTYRASIYGKNSAYPGKAPR